MIVVKIIILIFFSLIYSQQINFKLDTVSTKLNQPWGIEFLDDNNILITERNGQLLNFREDSIIYIKGIPEISNYGQGGLLDIKKHPDFKKNNFIYFTATPKEKDIVGTALFRSVLENDSLKSVEKLFQAEFYQPTGVHFGSRIAIDNEGFIYVSFGDGGTPASAQDLSNHNGTIIRLTLSGDVPNDNPFIDSTHAKAEIWSYGHRNVQGLAINPLTNEIWSHEHGPKGGDEINIIKKGINYGWPLATFGINYDGTIISKDTSIVGAADPLYYWTPSIAPCGMNFYNSSSIPNWNGSLFLGALAGKHLNRIYIKGEAIYEERLLSNMARFRQVIQGSDGWLYFITEKPGLLCRISMNELSVFNNSAPKDFNLHDNFPNPFNSSTRINFSNLYKGEFKLSIFNLLGYEIQSYVINGSQSSFHSITWNGADSKGNKVPGGIYFYKLHNDKMSITKKMILLK